MTLTYKPLGGKSSLLGGYFKCIPQETIDKLNAERELNERTEKKQRLIKERNEIFSQVKKAIEAANRINKEIAQIDQ